MVFILWLTTAVLIIHASNSYILLTANLEDVQAIAKQLASSPVGDQLTKMWRRAANQFNAQVQKTNSAPGSQPEYAQRADQRDEQGLSIADEPQQPQYPDMRNEEFVNEEGLNDNNQVERRSQQDDEVAALGRNASLYLNSIKKIFEKV